jgi:hypothetical protein
MASDKPPDLLGHGEGNHEVMTPDKPPDLLGHGEGNHEVMTRKLSIHLLCQPLMGFMVLTIRTMPIPA